LDAYAKNYARITNNPANYNVGYAQAQERNAEIERNRSTIADAALKTGRIDPQYLPAFMQIAQRHGHLETPEAITAASLADFGQYKNLLKSLEDSFIPGLGTETKNILKKGVSLIPGGTALTGLLAGGDTREKTLKALSGTARRLSDLGFEQDVRNFLSKESNHLSATEVEEILHPLSKEVSSKVSSLPDAGKIPSERREDRLQSFFGENITPDTSLLVMRDKLLDKGYSWETIRDALEADRRNLTAAQEREMAYIVQPPVQSLSHVFRGLFNFVDVLRGQK
jgi:hypothetical protein